MLELAVEPRPLNQIIKRLTFTAAFIVLGLGSFYIGSTVGAAKQLTVDQAEFSAWRSANACIGMPDFSKTFPKKGKVRQ